MGREPAGLRPPGSESGGLPAEPRRESQGIGHCRFAAGETANGSTQVLIRTFPTSNCTGTPNAYFDLNPIGPAMGRGLWIRGGDGSITESAGTVPQGTKSLLVSVSLNRTTGSVLTVNYDNFFFAPVGKPLCGGLVPTIGGSDVSDTIFGTDGPDVIVAFGGDDEVHAGDGPDFVCGGDGIDTVFGEKGTDALFGGPGADQLYGGANDDVRKGGRGNDLLGGGAGTDVCDGGKGKADMAEPSCEDLRKVP